MENQQNAKTIKWNEHDFPTPKTPDIGIEFFNINSGEKKVCDTEALITAYYNSSNLHVNAMVGQDMGWRLAPTTVQKMRDIRDDETVMSRIVTRFRLTEESEVTDSHILTYMFQEAMRKAGKDEEAKQNAYARQYEDDLRALDGTSTTDTETTTQPKATKSTTRLSPAQKKVEAKRAADAKRREENIAAGRDVNDGIETETTGDETSQEDSDKKLANSDETNDNDTQS